MYMNESEQITDDFNTALNTYRYLILKEDPYDIAGGSGIVSFFIDVFEDYESLEDEIAANIVAAQLCISVFEDKEHYEKCADLLEFQKEKMNNNGI